MNTRPCPLDIPLSETLLLRFSIGTLKVCAFRLNQLGVCEEHNQAKERIPAVEPQFHRTDKLILPHAPLAPRSPRPSCPSRNGQSSVTCLCPCPHRFHRTFPWQDCTEILCFLGSLRCSCLGGRTQDGPEIGRPGGEGVKANGCGVPVLFVVLAQHYASTGVLPGPPKALSVVLHQETCFSCF